MCLVSACELLKRYPALFTKIDKSVLNFAVFIKVQFTFNRKQLIRMLGIIVTCT